MITAFALYEKFCGTYNTQQGGHVRPNRNFIDWVNDISNEMFGEYVAVAEKNQMVSDYLSPFLRSRNVIVNQLAGSFYDVVTFPTDYEHFSSARVFLNTAKVGCACGDLETIDGKTGDKCTSPIHDVDDDNTTSSTDDLCEVRITKVDNQRWGSICNHKTQGPSLENPKITQYEGGFKIAPKSLGIIVLDYYRKPVEASFLYTITNPGAIDEYYQFDPNSQSLEWSSTLINEFVDRLGKKYGKYVREAFIYQAADADLKADV